MTAPLSRFLTRFSAPPTVASEAGREVPQPVPEPLVVMTAEELEVRIETARHEAVEAAEASHAAEIARIATTHATVAAEALASAREGWIADEGSRLAALLEAATAELRALVCERTVAVLRPWLAEAATARARHDLGGALDRLLTDTKSPCLRVCGPADLVDAMREARPDAPVEWTVTETIDVTVIADATRVETRLAAALADLTIEG